MPSQPFMLLLCSALLPTYSLFPTFPSPTIHYVLPVTYCLLPSTSWCLVSTTYYVLPATCYPLLVTYHYHYHPIPNTYWLQPVATYWPVASTTATCTYYCHWRCYCFAAAAATTTCTLVICIVPAMDFAATQPAAFSCPLPRSPKLKRLVTQWCTNWTGFLQRASDRLPSSSTPSTENYC